VAQGSLEDSRHRLLAKLQTDSAAENAEAACLLGHQQKVVGILQGEIKHLNTMPSELQAALGVVSAALQGKVCHLHLVTLFLLYTTK
jgi:hypothetical protein